MAAQTWLISYVYGDVMSFIVLGSASAVLGPLFFILYMTDLADWAAKYGVYLYAYTDDTQLYRHFSRNEIASTVD